MGRARQLADGGLNDAVLMDASAADTDVNDNILLEGTDSTSTDAGFNLLYEDGTHDASVALTPSSFTLDALNVSGTTTFESAVTADGTINSNAGITFPTEQVQSTTANVLDDYEEGTWTVDPDANIGGNLTFTSDTEIGTYVKIGRLCYISATVQVSTVSSTNDVNLSLPFAHGGNPTNGQAPGIGAIMTANASSGGPDHPANTVNVTTWIGNGNSFMAVYASIDNDNINGLSNNELAANDQLYINACYVVAT